MRIDERLTKQNQQIAENRRRQQDGEETLMYMERHREASLNRYRGAFTDKMESGINTRQSVFDRTAIFHTGED